MTEERAPYSNSPSLVDQLRAMSRHEHGDFTIGEDAADEIERLRYAVSALLEALDNAAEALDSDNPDIQLRAALAARETIKRIEGEA